MALTVGWDDPRPGEISLVPDKNYGLVLGVILSPEVVENIFHSSKGCPIHDGVNDDACVRFVGGQGIFNLKHTVQSINP